eukprot:6199806-Pleurochrysis_carterae.AAC.2
MDESSTHPPQGGGEQWQNRERKGKMEAAVKAGKAGKAGNARNAGNGGQGGTHTCACVWVTRKSG